MYTSVYQTSLSPLLLLLLLLRLFVTRKIPSRRPQMLYPAVWKCWCLYTMYHINNNAFSCVLKVVRLQSDIVVTFVCTEDEDQALCHQTLCLAFSPQFMRFADCIWTFKCPLKLYFLTYILAEFVSTFNDVLLTCIARPFWLDVGWLADDQSIDALVSGSYSLPQFLWTTAASWLKCRLVRTFSDTFSLLSLRVYPMKCFAVFPDEKLSGEVGIQYWTRVLVRSMSSCLINHLLPPVTSCMY